MSNEMMWFGNRAKMQWVPCPQVGATYTSNGRGEGGTFLHGGSFRRQTFNTTKGRVLTWPLASRETLRPITDYAEGVYGPGAIYWVDPFESDVNVLPQSFATPSLGCYDAITLNGQIERPRLIQTQSNDNGYPPQSAAYTLNSVTDSPFRLWLPIPPGYRISIGAQGVSLDGSSASSFVFAQPTRGTVASGVPAIAVPVRSVASTQHTTTHIDSSATVDGVEIYLGGTGEVALSGMMAHYARIGAPVTAGGFVSGQGHSGMSFDGYPERNAYSAALDLVGLSAAFVETEQWK